MEYQKIVNFFDDATNQRPKLKTKNWIELCDIA